MSIYALKSRFQQLLRPLVVRLASMGVTANQVTITAALLSLVVAAILLMWANQPSGYWLYGVVPLWMFVRMALNAVDGMLAREHGQQSVLGGYLNELGDIVSDAALYLPFAYLAGVHPIYVFAIIWLSAVVEAAGILGGATRHYHGPMGKSDRAFVFGVLAFWVALFGVPVWANWLLIGIVILLFVSLIRRVNAGVNHAA